MQEFLVKALNQEPLDLCDHYLSERIGKGDGTSYGNLAERSVACQVLRYNGRWLADLLSHWGCASSLTKPAIQAEDTAAASDM